ncbi:tetraacyldisaccharide 4'-kinase [Niabella terrae]
MSFSRLTKKNFLLIPFSWLYKAGAFIYHSLYDWRVLPSRIPDIATICVGNLSAGGTGKTPMVEYLIGVLKDRYEIAVLSRGYGRKTRGFLLADPESTAADIGDEPLQFFKKYPDLRVAVGEDRTGAICQLQQQFPQLELIILDDAFQHRKVRAGLNILLTAADNLFPNDWYLPAGSLRDMKSGYKRADLIIVTKADPDLSPSRAAEMVQVIRPLDYQQVFFSSIAYGTPYHLRTGQSLALSTEQQVVLVTGIARPESLLTYFENLHIDFQHLAFSDHHDFSQKEIGEILRVFDAVNKENKIILTTEKDAMRLGVWPQLMQLPVFVLPIAHRFLFNHEPAVRKAVSEYLAVNTTGPGTDK